MGSSKIKNEKDCTEDNVEENILSSLRGSEDGRSMKVKELRKQVCLSMQLDQDDKATKKRFKKAILSLEEGDKLTLDEDGVVTLSKAERKSRKRSCLEGKKEKKRKRNEKKAEENNDTEADSKDEEFDATASNKHKTCKGNPKGITRLFVGNLPFAVDEATLCTHLMDAMTHVKWITDQETGKFYGSAFVEMRDSVVAAEAVFHKNGAQLMGRPLKVTYAPARPGDVWPPVKRTSLGQAHGAGLEGMSSQRPPACKKLFVGNVSFDIDDEGLTKFFAAVDAQVKSIRWLYHKDSGDFKGCGFVEFWNEDACTKAAELNGKNLLGRPIRLDWTD